jgi:O-acetyl-ADP-ribose deacetylase (regulator of RNase III)
MSDAVTASLVEAEKEKLTTVGMTLMGSGVFGWKADAAARVLVKALLSWARSTGSSQIKQVDVDHLVDLRRHPPV